MYFIQSNAAELLAASGPSPFSVQGRLAAKITMYMYWFE